MFKPVVVKVEIFCCQCCTDSHRNAIGPHSFIEFCLSKGNRYLFDFSHITRWDLCRGFNLYMPELKCKVLLGIVSTGLALNNATDIALIALVCRAQGVSWHMQISTKLFEAAGQNSSGLTIICGIWLRSMTWTWQITKPRSCTSLVRQKNWIWPRLWGKATCHWYLCKHSACPLWMS